MIALGGALGGRHQRDDRRAGIAELEAENAELRQHIREAWPYPRVWMRGGELAPWLRAILEGDQDE